MKLVREHINERFEEESDPIEDMGIGARAQIRKWFEAWAPDVKYTIDNDLNISVEGSLDLRGTRITELPESLKVKGKIYKDF